MKLKKIVVLAACTLLLAGCGNEVPPEQQDEIENTSGNEPAAAERISIYTVNYPLAYFAGRIVGDRGDVIFPAPADVDPAYWTPDAETIAAYQGADLILDNGAGYAGWVANASLPRSRLLDTSKVFADAGLLIDIKDTISHSHGPAGEHSHDRTAITTWLDLDIARSQARTTFYALLQARPEYEAEFTAAFDSLDTDLSAIDERLVAATAILGDRPVLYSHPVYQYFERRYNINGLALHWEPDEVPDERSWRELGNILTGHPAELMIWEGEPLPRTRERLAALDIDIIVLEPGGNRPSDGNLLDLLNTGASALEAYSGELE